jgi:hypothetical protein
MGSNDEEVSRKVPKQMQGQRKKRESLQYDVA